MVDSRKAEDSRRVSEDDAEKIAEHMANKLILRLTDPETVEGIMKVWTQAFDQSIGRAFRKGMYIILLGVVLAVAIKMEVLSKLLMGK
jgi:hypothetical protein